MYIQEIKWVICTIRDYHIGMIIINSLKEAGYSGKIAISCHSETEARKLREHGADLTLIPYRDAAYEAVDRILDHDKKD